MKRSQSLLKEEKKREKQEMQRAKSERRKSAPVDVRAYTEGALVEDTSGPTEVVETEEATV